MNVHAILQRVLPPVERIGTGLLRLASASEQQRQDERPRNIGGPFWVRPSEVEAVFHARSTRDVVIVRTRSGKEFDVPRKMRSYGVEDETRDEHLARVVKELGWTT